MTDEQIQKYTFRITSANKTELIEILYEMTMDYMEDAKKYHSKEQREEYRDEIRKAKNCIQELIASLHFAYPLAKNYLQLYSYVNRLLIRADIKNQTEHLDEAKKILKTLSEGYEELQKLDTSGPVMSNTQSVYAGLTYGKNQLTENLINHSGNRGFRV